jgi:hypothetical protein
MLEDKITKTNWPNLVFMAEGSGEWFENVTVVTLKSHFVDKVYEAAWNSIHDAKQLDETAIQIMESRSIEVQQYVNIDEFSSVEVCLNHDEITDAVVEEALELLIDIGVTPNTHTEFGEKYSFLPADVPKYKFEPTLDIPANNVYNNQRDLYR